MQTSLNPDDSSAAGGFWTGSVVMAGLVAGSALQVQQRELWPALVYVWMMAIPSVAASLVAINGRVFRCPFPGARGLRLRHGVLWGFGALLLGFGVCGQRATVFLQHGLNPALEGRDLAAVGVVAAMPQRNEGGVRFRLNLESAALDGAPVAVPPQVLLGWYGGAAMGMDGATLELQRQPADLRPGERWQLTVRLKAPHGNLNPQGFDYELWLWEQGVQAAGYVRSGLKDPAPQRLGVTAWHPVERARHAVRDAIQAHVSDGSPERQRSAGILTALVTGDQAAIERADWDIFRATGVAHLMSISGLHITLFAWVAAALIGAFWRRSALWGWRLCLWLPAPSAALIGGVALATAYAVFSGWGVPAQRTIWMLVAVGLLRLTGRQWPWPTVWLLACTVVVLRDPWALMQAGFWLSFVAVGVLFATDSGADNDRSTLGWRHFHHNFRQLLHEQWVVTLALTPLSLLLFGQVSVVGLLANLLAIPWVTLVVTPLALGGVMVPALWDAAVWALRPLATGLGVLAGVPFATVSVAAAPVWAGAAGVLGGVVLAARLPWGMRVLGLPLLLPVLFWQAPRPAPGEFELLAADIGQGNAVIVRTAGHALVYDAGPRFSVDSDAGHRVLVPLLRALDERVDTLVLSHRDTDHTGGARAVLAMQPQAALLSSIADSHELQVPRAATRCVAGQRWTWDGVAFEILHPQAADYDSGARPNALSCVLRIGNGGRSALLAGDIEAAQEARLVASGRDLRADVLLMPHHGSKTSSTPEFLDAVRPQVALAQAGYRNRFGHPAPPVLARYRERGIRVVDSARCGAALWSSAAPEVICQRDVARRYWHHRVP
jgi:competence protein ComEC